MLDVPYGYISSLKVDPILDDIKTASRFKEIISSDEEMIKIENDLRNLNSYLSEKIAKS